MLTHVTIFSTLVSAGLVTIVLALSGSDGWAVAAGVAVGAAWMLGSTWNGYRAYRATWQEYRPRRATVAELSSPTV